jgi:transcriptional antiterminator RfaH
MFSNLFLGVLDVTNLSGSFFTFIKRKMNSFKQGWYVLYTKPRMDRQVVNRLVELKMEVLAPVRKVLKTWHDRRKYVDSFLFPSYVFVYLYGTKDYYHCVDTEGALSFVRFGREIATVSNSVIDNLRIVTENGKDIKDIAVSDALFPPGKKVYIKDGPLTGLLCEIVKVDSKDKAVVRVSLLNRNLLLSLSGESLLEIVKI